MENPRFVSRGLTLARVAGEHRRQTRPVKGGARKGRAAMRELIRTNDPVRLSWLTALLADADIEAIVLDQHTSAIEGSILAIPRRLMVDDDDWPRAHRLLADAGEFPTGEAP